MADRPTTQKRSGSDRGVVQGARRSPAPVMGDRAIRTRDLILEQSKQLFLELGYGGTRIENITEACGISRAGFYTYFPSKRDVFLALGETTYREISLVIDQFEDLPDPCGPAELDVWVRAYFGFMDVHGAFMLGAAQTGPSDDDVREVVRQLHPRTARRLGKMIRAHQSSPHGDETAMGLTVLAMLDRSWYFCHGAKFPVDEDAVIATVVEVIVSLLVTAG